MSKTSVNAQPTPTRKTPDRFAQAGRVARRLAELDAAEARALAEAPADISKRYLSKREAVLEAYTPEVRELVEKMRAPDAEGPESE